jgi:hypothetical protein
MTAVTPVMVVMLVISILAKVVVAMLPVIVEALLVVVTCVNFSSCVGTRMHPARWNSKSLKVLAAERSTDTW